MSQRQDHWAVRVRRKMIQDLGGRCVNCGVTENLEINHITGRVWEVNQVSSSQRVILYKREMREGKLNVLCRKCNAGQWPNGRKT